MVNLDINPASVTGDRVQAGQTDISFTTNNTTNRISFGGFEDDVKKVIGIHVPTRPVGAQDLLYYNTTSGDTSTQRQLLSVNVNGNYIFTNPDTTAVTQTLTIGSSTGVIAAQSGDWVIISPSATGNALGLEFNVRVVRSDNTSISANTVTFNGADSLANLELTDIYFDTQTTDTTRGRFVDEVVVLEHSSTGYISHSGLNALDVSNDFFGQLTVGDGSEYVEYENDMGFGGDVFVVGDIKNPDGTVKYGQGSGGDTTVPDASEDADGAVFLARNLADSRDRAVTRASTVQTALASKQDKIVGVSGEFVQFNGAGILVGVPAPTGGGGGTPTAYILPNAGPGTLGGVTIATALTQTGTINHVPNVDTVANALSGLARTDQLFSGDYNDLSNRPVFPTKRVYQKFNNRISSSLLANYTELVYPTGYSYSDVVGTLRVEFLLDNVVNRTTNIALGSIPVFDEPLQRNDRPLDIDLNGRALGIYRVQGTNEFKANLGSGGGAVEIYFQVDSSSIANVSSWAFNNSGEQIPADLLQNAPTAGGGATRFTGLLDTPDTLVANRYLKTNSSGNAIEIVEFPITTDQIAQLPNISTNTSRITALENGSSGGGNSPAVQELHRGLTETHTAGAITRVAPYDMITRLKVSSPTSITGDMEGIVVNPLPDSFLFEYTGFSDDIHKVIALNVDFWGGATEDVLSYQIPEHSNIVHHLLQD